MSLTFEKNPLLLGLSGGVVINTAIVAMNTLPGKNIQRMTGMPLFTIGWVMVIMSFLNNDTRSRKYRWVLAGSSVGVYMAAMMARMMMESGTTGLPMKLTMMKFMMCWLTIGLLIGMKNHGGSGDSDDSDEDPDIPDVTEEEEVHDKTIHFVGLLPPALVIMSMMSINKFERPNSIASGPGMPIFMMAWVILSLVNSLKI